MKNRKAHTVVKATEKKNRKQNRRGSYLIKVRINKKIVNINTVVYDFYTVITTNMIEKIRKLGLSQAEVASILGLSSRQTIAKIERGERTLTKEEKQKLEDYVTSFAEEDSPMRVNIPQKNIEKFKQVFLYIIEKVGARPNIGMTVLYKLLYFIDFDYYEKYEEQLMGLTYFKNTYGPVPREFKKVIDEMIQKEDIINVKNKRYKYEQQKYLPTKSPNLSILNGQELEMIDSVLERYGDKSATQISELSHRDTPWSVAEDNGNLEYEHAFYRPDEFSVREYDPL